jgi:hypothetical protein
MKTTICDTEYNDVQHLRQHILGGSEMFLGTPGVLQSVGQPLFGLATTVSRPDLEDGGGRSPESTHVF